MVFLLYTCLCDVRDFSNETVFLLIDDCICAMNTFPM